MDRIAVLAAIAVVGITAMAIRDVPSARRAGRPWRGKAVVWGSGLLLGLTLLLIRPVNGWLSFVITLGCCFGMSEGALMARREESAWSDREHDS